MADPLPVLRHVGWGGGGGAVEIKETVLSAFCQVRHMPNNHYLKNGIR